MPYTPKRINTDALREIKKTMSRFLSLFLLSALAVAFLAGLRTTAPIWNTPPTSITTAPI